MKLCRRFGQHWRQRCSSHGLDFELRGTLFSHSSLSMNEAAQWVEFSSLEGVQHTGLPLILSDLHIGN